MYEPKFVLYTPSIRPQNIPLIYRSVKPFINKYDIQWYICYDSWTPVFVPEVNDSWVHQYTYKEDGGIAGNHQRNYLLDQIQDGYCFSLDDDTIIHKDFFPVLYDMILRVNKGIYLFHDLLALVDEIYYAREGNIKEGKVGNQNFVFHKKLIGMRRMGIHYCADGEFIEKLVKEFPRECVYIDKVLAYHNRLLRDDWEEFLVKEGDII